MEVKKLKVAVVREELVAITNDFIIAIILNQFLYWSDRVNDSDKMLEEERAIAKKDGIEINYQPKCGWIYKKYDELMEETMINISKKSFKAKVDWLVENEYLFVRNNPIYKWDKTKQYRVNFSKLIFELNKKGYTLQTYSFSQNSLEPPKTSNRQICPFEVEKTTYSKEQIYSFDSVNLPVQYQRLHTENNKENTNNIRNNSITHIISTKETAKTEDNSVENSVENKTEQKKEKTQTEKPIEKNNQLIKILSDRIPNKKARHLFVDFLNDRKNRLSLPVTYNFIMDALKYLDQYAGDDPEEIINVINASIERGRGWIERVYTKNKKAVLTERSYDIKTLDEEYDIIAETGFQEETGDFLNTHKVDDDVKSTDFERISAELLAEDMETKQFKQIEEQKKAKIQELNDKIREIQDKIKSTESNIEKQNLTIKLKELQVELAFI